MVVEIKYHPEHIDLTIGQYVSYYGCTKRHDKANTPRAADAHQVDGCKAGIHWGKVDKVYDSEAWRGCAVQIAEFICLECNQRHTATSVNIRSREVK